MDHLLPRPIGDQVTPIDADAGKADRIDDTRLISNAAAISSDDAST
jgi:sugar lactone lactonase YvrE